MRRRFRLRRSADFDRLHRRGERWLHPLIFLLTGVNGLAYSRYGFSVSRRLGSAVERNRIKRLMREAVRNHKALSTCAGWDFLFIARPEANGAKYSDIDQAIAHVLTRSRIMNLSSSNQPSERNSKNLE